MSIEHEGADDVELAMHSLDRSERTAAGERVRAALAAAKAENNDLRLERDLAIAHDRQPYPTAWAYEQACRVMYEAKAERDAALRAALDRVIELCDSDDVYVMAGVRFATTEQIRTAAIIPNPGEQR